jgi:two-component system, OmpR family, response regulator
MKCLVVEDDPSISGLVIKSLAAEGFLVTHETQGDEALDRLLRESFDVAVLDIMIPGRDGLSVLRMIREKGINTPVLLLTARSSLVERVEGLEHGADDYLTKPFHIEELIARIKALARRAQTGILTLLSAGSLSVNLGSREVLRDSESIELSNREFELLVYLLKNKNRVLSRTQICEHVWGYYFDVNDNLVDVYVKRLRNKVEMDGEPKLIHTIRGVGYCIREES